MLESQRQSIVPVVVLPGAPLMRVGRRRPNSIMKDR
jgi:hypothetical protein